MTSINTFQKKINPRPIWGKCVQSVHSFSYARWISSRYQLYRDGETQRDTEKSKEKEQEGGQMTNKLRAAEEIPGGRCGSCVSEHHGHFTVSLACKDKTFGHHKENHHRE